MEEKKKGMSPILIVILTIIGICLVGFCTWYGVNYFKGEKESNVSDTTVDESSNLPTNNSGTKEVEDNSHDDIYEFDCANVKVPSVSKDIVDSYIKSKFNTTRIFTLPKIVEKDNTINSVKENIKVNNSISKEKLELYNTLRLNNGSFYFNKSVNIDNILAHDFLEYVLGMYVEENSIKFADEENFECVNDIEKETGNGNVTSLDGVDMGDYTYHFDTKTYYFGHGYRGSASNKIFTKLIAVEEDNANIYFYDRAVYCSWGPGNACWSSSDQELYTSAIFEFNDIDNGEKYDEIKSVNDGDLILNEDYVFNKYADKLNTYKHTFKKVNGNYYWVSSEIVK